MWSVASLSSEQVAEALWAMYNVYSRPRGRAVRSPKIRVACVAAVRVLRGGQ